MIERRLRLTSPLDLAGTLRPLQRGGPWDPSTRVGAGEAWRATMTAGGPATTRYSRIGDEVTVTAWGPGAEAALEAAPDIIGEHDSRAGFEPRHPLLRDLDRRLAGFRLTRS